MLGFGPLGGLALGELPISTVRLTGDILKSVVTEFANERKLLPLPPAELHHFTSLETAYRIIEGDDVRLSHAEYSNDQTEMAEAKEIRSPKGVRRSQGAQADGGSSRTIPDHSNHAQQRAQPSFPQPGGMSGSR